MISDDTQLDAIFDRWQRMLDLLARVSKTPLAMINRVRGEDLEVAALNAEVFAFGTGDRIPMRLNSYCARMLRSGMPLAVEDASGMPEMADNPSAALGYVSYYGLPLRDGDGTLYGTVCVLGDTAGGPTDEGKLLIELVREFIEQDLALQTRNEKLARGGQAARLALAQAERASREKSNFLAQVQHELRTPLNAVTGFAQLLEMGAEGPLTPRQQARIRQLLDAGVHLSGLIDDLLDLSTAELGKMTVDMRACRLDEILAEAAAHLQVQAASRQVAIRLPLEPGPTVWADPRRLTQVFSNVLSNAVKYNRDGGTVEVSLSSGESGVLVSIADTGIGMTPLQMDRLFEPFQRMGMEHSSIQGTGLGLALCQQLMQLMNGSIAIDSVFGVGTTVSLQLSHAMESRPALADLPH